MTFAHLTIATRNAAVTSRFYQDTFRWRQLHMPGNIEIGADWLEIVPGQQIHILQIENFEPSPFEEEFGRHLALFHPADDFDALRQRLVDNGAEIIPPIRETPFPRFFFRDPNGYMVEVINQDAYRVENSEK